jgi:hypothetical protein
MMTGTDSLQLTAEALVTVAGIVSLALAGILSRTIKPRH